MTKEQRDRLIQESFFPFGMIMFYGTPLTLLKYDPPVCLVAFIIYMWVYWLDLVVIQQIWDPLAPDLSREPEE